jgi:phospholipase C
VTYRRPWPIVHLVTVSRRTLLGAAGVAGALTATGGYRLFGESADAAVVLPPPGDSGIEHVVVLMMENRSFDHFLGWMGDPQFGADGMQAGLTYLDRYRMPQDTHHLLVTSSCGFQDPDHSYEGGRIELNGGACNGWLRAGLNDSMSIGYYEQPDLEFLGQAAADWTTCDRYFAAVMAETYPNRFYMHCAQTDRLHNSLTFSTMPTIWDRLKAKSVTGKYYYGDIPFALLLGSHSPARALVGDPLAPLPGTFFADAAAGSLPAVSFVDPRFQDEDAGTSNDDHPHADIRAGEAFMNQVYDAIRTSPNWPSTVFVITYDEWGGFFDHVAPGHAADVARKTSLRGFRVPTVVISPLARRNHVAHQTFDHTSILRMIEWRWGLKPLTPRDKNAHNLANVLDFTVPPDISSSPYTVAPFDSQTAKCPETALSGAEAREWAPLRKMALEHGWKVG